jgi:pimeloyl-ACP methyl ester carboxylesterase
MRTIVSVRFLKEAHNSLDWSMVQPEAAKFTKVCSYDRAGSGWSETSPKKPRVSSVIVEELHALLQSADLKSPYIFVGHSFGGINVRMYERNFPNEVAGIVLVDSSHENQIERMNLSTEIPSWERSFFVSLKAYTGLTRIERQLGEFPESWGKFDEVIRKIYFAKINTTKSILAVAEESENIALSMKQMREADTFIGNKPLIVITAGKYDFDGVSKIVTEKVKEEQRIWNELQLDLAAKSSSGKQIVTMKSGHMIPYNQPEIIVDAIKEVLDELSKRNPK